MEKILSYNRKVGAGYRFIHKKEIEGIMTQVIFERKR